MDDSRATLFVFLFTDIVGSVKMRQRLGDRQAAELQRRHDELFDQAMTVSEAGGDKQDCGDGFLAHFKTASDAARTALRFQYAIHNESWGDYPIRVRIGFHLGEAASSQEKTLAKDIANRLMNLAQPDQILMSGAAFDAARQIVREHPSITPELAWRAHGPYDFEGVEHAMDVCEVGAVGVAPLTTPPDRPKAKRAIQRGQEPIYSDETDSDGGWRPGIDQSVPSRDDWVLQRELGAGGFGEVWLAKHRKMNTNRAFKFCFNADRLQSLKREITLFRVLRETLGERPDIARLHDFQFDKAPFYLESEFTELGNLADWAEARGGIDQLPIATRLDIVIRVCDAIAAAHSVAVLHKDIKPSNILIYEAEDGSPRPEISDFGIGILTDPSQLAAMGITGTGLDEEALGDNKSSRTFSRMYTPPEALMSQPFTIQGDVYALGVLLYQMVAGDLRRPLATGWEADIDDPLLREDITRATAGRPEDRFGSASELAERLRNLDTRRRARVVRRTVKVTAAASVVLALLLAASGALYVRERNHGQQVTGLLGDAVTARNEAEVAQSEAEAYAIELGALHAANFETMIVFLGEFESRIAQLDGSLEARETLVTAARENLVRVREVSEDPRVLRSIARAYEKIGDVLGSKSRPSRGDPAAALENYQEALDLCLALLDDDPDDTDLRMQVVNNQLKVAGMLRLTGKTAAARDVAMSAKGTAARFDQADPHAKMQYASVLQKVGDILKRLDGYTNDVRTNFEQSLRIRRYLVEMQPGEFERQLATGLGRLANYWRDVGEYDRAVDMDQEALEIRRPLAEDKGWSPGTTNSWIIAALFMCESHLAAGDTQSAGELATECLDRAKERSRANPDNANAKFLLAVAQENVANVLAAKEDWAEAGKAYARCYGLVEPLFKQHPTNMSFALRLATVHAELGEVALAQDQLIDARTQYSSSLTIVDDILLPDKDDREYRKLSAKAKSAIGAVLLRQESPDQAVSLDDAVSKLVEARHEYEQLMPDDPESALMDVEVREGLVLTLQRLVEAQRARGNTGEASVAVNAMRSLLEGHPDERRRQQLENDLAEFLVEASDDGGE